MKANDPHYRITIHDIHTVDNDTSDTTMTVFGHLDETEEGYVIRYLEQTGDLAGTTVDVVFEKEPNTVAIHRRGPNQMELFLEEGKRHNCVYDLEEGRLIMGVDTHSVQSSMSRFGGHLALHYDIDFNAGFVSANQLEITVKEIFS